MVKRFSICFALVVALAMLPLFWGVAQAAPKCPAQWPDWGFGGSWSGPVRHHGQDGAWVIFGDATTMRAYPASGQYRVGYEPEALAETCYWSIRREDQIVFGSDD